MVVVTVPAGVRGGQAIAVRQAMYARVEIWWMVDVRLRFVLTDGCTHLLTRTPCTHLTPTLTNKQKINTKTINQ